jgi:DNA-binding phage protein
MKHTPGPWFIGPMDTEHHCFKDGSNTVILFRRIQTVPGRGQHEKHVLAWVTACGNDGNLEANANFIAAAPDLLNALETLERVARKKGIPTEAAQAAIKKAKGGP